MLIEDSIMPHLTVLGLDFNPFPVVPDSHNYFTTKRMYSAISDVLHCIDARKGFILISGEVGLGKTTLSRLLLKKLEIKRINTSLVLNTFLQSASLIKAINNDFNIFIESNDISDQLDALNKFLLEQYGQNKNCVIVIDDAQQLSLESLELIRQLSNLETNQNKLVQIILIAQSEILTTLNRNDMRQLKSRIALNIGIEALTLNELDLYIDFRLARAGSNKKITFEKNALNLLHKLTKGYPRQVNLVMDRCLYVVAAFGENKINKALIAKAHEEISLPTENKPFFRLNYNWLVVVSVIIVAVVFVSYEYQNILLNILKNTSSSKMIASNETKLINLANVKQTITKLQSKVESKIELTPANSNEHIYIYLQQFGLSSLSDSFVESITSNDFKHFEKQLFTTFGYKILLSDIKIPSNHDKEIWKFTIANNHRWLTFWKPDINLYAFYQGYYSDDIETLQNNLQDEGLYRSVIDGIVGEETITAISKFQKSIGLNTSGFPDEMTLYQLQKSNINSLNIGTDLPAINKKNKTRKYNNKVITKPVYSLVNNSITTDLEQ